MPKQQAPYVIRQDTHKGGFIVSHAFPGMAVDSSG
jgi:hypothetical protein